MKNFIEYKISYIPIIGIILYVIMHLGAYLLLTSNGGFYSYSENLFCDMMLDASSEDKFVVPRIIAIAGHLALSIGMICLFYILPKIFLHYNLRAKIIRWFGMLSMFSFTFLSTVKHDLFVTVTGILGITALIPLAVEYIKARKIFIFHSIFAILCILLSLLVFFIFETKILIDDLAMIQSVVFVLDSIWVFWVCKKVIDTNKTMQFSFK